MSGPPSPDAADDVAAPAGGHVAGRRLPGWLLPSLQGYQPAWLRFDILAGVAAGTVVIPQAMAYATLAGLPVQIGLYTCMLPMLAYALLGGSRSLSISTTSTIAVLAASALAKLPAGRSADDLLRAAFTLTVLVGCCLVLMWGFKLGSLVEQISPATLTGIKAGVGLTVAASQLPALLGLDVDIDGLGFFDKVGTVLTHLSGTNLVTLAVSAVAVAVLVLLRRFAPLVPGPLVVVGGAILLVAFTPIEENGLALIAPVPSGLPSLSLPVWSDVAALLPSAAAISIMAFMETVLVARAQRQRSEPPIDSNRELLANGVAALAGGFASAMPPAGGFSQSAVNQRAGARSQLSGVVTAVLAVMVALWLSPVLQDLPSAILAAMVLVAVLGLVSVRAFVELFGVSRAEFWVALVTAVFGLTAGLLEAVALGVVLTLVLVLRALSVSRAEALYRWSDGQWRTRPPAEGAASASIPGVLAVRLRGPLYTGNARPTQDDILARALAAAPLTGVVIEASEVSVATTPMIEMIEALFEDLKREGTELLVSGLPAEPLEKARHSRWFAGFVAGGGVAATLESAIASLSAQRVEGPDGA